MEISNSAPPRGSHDEIILLAGAETSWLVSTIQYRLRSISSALRQDNNIRINNPLSKSLFVYSELHEVCLRRKFKLCVRDGTQNWL